MKYLFRIFVCVIVIKLLTNCSFFSPSRSKTNNIPTVRITYPSEGAVLDGRPITIRANAEDDDGIDKVSFVINGEIISEDHRSPYEYLWNARDWSESNVHRLLVKAIDNSGNVGQSDLIIVTISIKDSIPETPAAPQNVKISIGEEMVTLSWDTNSSLTYNIYWSDSKGVTKKNGIKIPNVKSRFDHFELKNGVTYYYIVTAANNYLEGHPSNEINATPKALYINFKTSMPTGWSFLTSSVVKNKIYVMGGINSSGAMNAIEEYDVGSNYWSTIEPIPTPRSHLTSAVVNDKIYAIGGSIDSRDSDTVEEFDPQTFTWSTKARKPTNASSQTSSVANGKIYVFGGLTRGYIYPNVEEYDPTTDQWRTKSRVPTIRAYSTSSTIDDKIYVFGGISDEGISIDIVEEYNPATDQWRTKTRMPTARAHLTSSTVNDKIYVIGGVSLRGDTLNIIEEYDPSTDTWVTKSPLPTARAHLTSCTLWDKIYVLGGRNGNTNLKIVEEYNPLFDNSHH